jgi:hypothetical protein
MAVYQRRLGEESTGNRKRSGKKSAREFHGIEALLCFFFLSNLLVLSSAHASDYLFITCLRQPVVLVFCCSSMASITTSNESCDNNDSS